MRGSWSTSVTGDPGGRRGAGARGWKGAIPPYREPIAAWRAQPREAEPRPSGGCWQQRCCPSRPTPRPWRPGWSTTCPTAMAGSSSPSGTGSAAWPSVTATRSSCTPSPASRWAAISRRSSRRCGRCRWSGSWSTASWRSRPATACRSTPCRCACTRRRAASAGCPMRRRPSTSSSTASWAWTSRPSRMRRCHAAGRRWRRSSRRWGRSRGCGSRPTPARPRRRANGSGGSAERWTGWWPSRWTDPTSPVNGRC